MPSSVTIGEIILFSLFIFIIFRLFQKRTSHELITFVLPLILFHLFIEIMSIRAHNFVFDLERFHFLIFDIPVIILVGWVVIVYFAFFLTDRIFIPFKPSIFILNATDGFFVALIYFIINHIGVKFGWWIYLPEASYLLKGYFLGLPVWETIGCFLAIFLFSFGYRTFKKFDFPKRVILTYSYIFLILGARFFVYVVFSK